MSVTIDSLDIQIRSSAGSAAKNIDELADKLGKLNQNAKVTKIVNSLSNLNKALSDMKSQQAVMSHLSALSKSLSSLAAIPKLTGLQSAIRELKKLPEVMQSLDTAEISQFTSKMKLLESGLSPLATQIDKIGKGFSKLPPQVSKCVTAVKRLDSANRAATKSTNDHGDALKGQRFNLLAYYENLSNVFSMLHGVQDAAAKLLNDAIQWDGIQFRFGRAFGEDAEMVLEYAEKVSKELRINQQMFMQYSSMYGSLLSGFGMAQEQVTTISVGLTELSYDIWAAYNDRYRTLEDASEAIRSAITGEIEPIRNAGIALTEASMQEFADGYNAAASAANNTVTALEEIRGSMSDIEAKSAETQSAITDMLGNGISNEAMQATADMLGLGMSVEKMTEAQKSELRYAVMVNSAMQQGIVGTYAREMDTAEGVVRTLTQQLKTLGQAIGSLFIPIIQRGLPWVTAFVELLTEGVIALGRLFGIEFQEIQWGDAAGMKQTADGANATANALGAAAKNAKKMVDYTMGFDELNVIKPPSDSSGGTGGTAGAGGGSLGINLDTLWDKSVFEAASKQVDELKQKIKDYIEDHKLLLSVVGSTVAFLGFMKLLRGLNSLLGVSKTIDNLKDAFSGLKKKGKSLKDFVGDIKDFFKTAKQMAPEVGWLKALFPKTAMTTATVSEWVTGTLIPTITKVLKGLPRLLMNGIRAIPVWGWIVTAVVGLLTLAIVNYDFSDVGYKLGNALGTALKKVGGALAAIDDWLMGIRDAVIEGLGKAWEWVKEEFDINSPLEAILMMINPIYLVSKVLPKLIEIGSEILPGIWQGIKDGWNNFWGNIEEFIDGFVQGWKDALGIHSPSTVFAEIGTNIIAGLLNGITEKWDALKEWVNKNVMPKFTLEYWKGKFDVIRQAISNKLGEVKQAAINKWTEIKTWFSNNIAPKFTLSFWLDKFKNLKEGFTQTIKNAVNAGIDLMNKFIGWLNEKLNFSWDALTLLGKEVYPAGSIQLFTIPPIPRLADGGFVGAGQMFIAREAGPELVGNINGRTAVANNDQIVEAVSRGVYEAVVAAMSANRGSGSQNVNVYLDGKQIYASVKKTESERGRTIMGNQLGYAY